MGAGGGVVSGALNYGRGGGGGGGEVAFNNTTSLFSVSGTINVTVGSGVFSGNGTPSNFSTIGANGGGLASEYPASLYIGFNNSGGGSTQWGNFWGRGLKSSIYGNSNDGGKGSNFFVNPGNAGGGGGGAGGVGYDNGQPGKGSLSYGGDGGPGIACNITGTLTFYGGGGGGGSFYVSAAGNGGVGGGGTGTSLKATNGTDNTGGGAGQGFGAATTGGKGGSGIVVVRWIPGYVPPESPIDTDPEIFDNLIDSENLCDFLEKHFRYDCT